MIGAISNDHQPPGPSADPDHIIAPNARWSCNNLILFTDQIALDDLEVL
jgi:hypothetical protein